jgi:hypothetical protein
MPRDFTVDEGVLEDGLIEFGAGEAGEFGAIGPGAGGLDGIEQAGGDEIDGATGFVGDVLEARVEGDAHVGRDGPRSSGPDEAVDVLAGEGGVDDGGVLGHAEADVDGGAGVVLVLDFGFGEGGAAGDAPVDGLEAAVDVAFGEEVNERTGDDGLVFGRHGEVGLVPAAEDAEALEGGVLEVDVLLGVGAAGLADLGGRHLGFFGAEFAIHFDLDGEAVAVPAGDVGGVEAGHGAGLDDEVLEELVEGVAEVDVAVGVGGAVMQDIHGLAGACLANLAVEVLLLPLGEQAGLEGGKICLH